MGFFKRRNEKKKDKKQAPAVTETAIGESLLAESLLSERKFSASEFQRSQSIYSRRLTGVRIFEVQPISLTDPDIQTDMVLGEHIETTEGLITLGISIKPVVAAVSVTDSAAAPLQDGPYFKRGQKLSVSYSKYGESFNTEAYVIEVNTAVTAPGAASGAASGTASGAAENTQDNTGINYIVSIILCAEPVRYIRKHGRIQISWTVFFKICDDEINSDTDFDEFSRNLIAKTVDISKGGFKGKVEQWIARGTMIRCILETESGTMSSGELIGRVIRCYHVAGDTDKYEMTVSFITMDESVRDFLYSRLNDIRPEAVNTEAKITIAEQGLEASIELLPPQNNGADLTYEQLCSALENERVTYGIDYSILKQLAAVPHYNLEYVVAHCTMPVHGSEAVLTYHVNMNPSYTPKVNEDGTADFKDLELIHKVSTDALLAEKIHATPGTDGMSVTGEPIPAIPGKDHKFPAGKNTYINDEETALHSAIDGFISIVGGNINVLDTYIVEGDVQYTTGNIDHNGIVIVKGDVRSGFSVIAEGDLVIHGSVEAASVKAGGTVIIHGGCIGEACCVESGGSAAIKFIDGGTINTGGKLTASYILGAVVNCSDSIEMVDIGLIRNSHVTARCAINAKTIGCARTAADRTVVEVGNDPALLSLFKSTIAELEKFDKDLETIRTGIRTLTMMKYRQELTEDKAKILDTLKVLVEQHTSRRTGLIDKYEELKTTIDTLGFGEVVVTGVAYDGLKIIIGSCELVLDNEIKAARFYRSGGEVHIESLERSTERSQGLLRRADL